MSLSTKSDKERAGNRAGGRRRYSQQKAAGICAHSGCSAGPAPGRVRCERHLAMMREENPGWFGDEKAGDE